MQCLKSTKSNNAVLYSIITESRRCFYGVCNDTLIEVGLPRKSHLGTASLLWSYNKWKYKSHARIQRNFQLSCLFTNKALILLSHHLQCLDIFYGWCQIQYDLGVSLLRLISHLLCTWCEVIYYLNLSNVNGLKWSPGRSPSYSSGLWLVSCGQNSNILKMSWDTVEQF